MKCKLLPRAALNQRSEILNKLYFLYELMRMNKIRWILFEFVTIGDNLKAASWNHTQKLFEYAFQEKIIKTTARKSRFYHFSLLETFNKKLIFSKIIRETSGGRNLAKTLT